MRTLIAQETRYFTADKTEVVAEGDPRAAFLLVRKGSPVDAEVAQTYGIPTEPLASELSPMPGANVNTETATQRAARLHAEATRMATAQRTAAAEATTDGATARQVAGAIEGQVARATGEPASQAARAVLDHQRDSLTGSDLLTGAMAPKSAAYAEDNAGDNPEAGANPTPSDSGTTGAGAAAGVNSRTKEIPADTRPTGTGQGYAGSSGVAVPGAGTSPNEVSAGGATAGALGSTLTGTAPGAGLQPAAPLPPATNPPDTATANPPRSPDASESNAAEAARLAAERTQTGAGATPPLQNTLQSATAEADTSAGTLQGAQDLAEEKINPPSGV